MATIETQPYDSIGLPFQFLRYNRRKHVCFSPGMNACRFDGVMEYKGMREGEIAARIVLKRGIAQVRQDMPELKPAETGPLSLQTA